MFVGDSQELITNETIRQTVLKSDWMLNMEFEAVVQVQWIKQGIWSLFCTSCKKICYP